MTKDDAPTRNPQDYDREAGQKVEKKPKTQESPQQQHEDEDQG